MKKTISINNIIRAISKLTNKKYKYNFKTVVFPFLVTCILLSGIICLTIGIKGTYHTNRNPKNYRTTTSHFSGYEVYDSDEGIKTHTTYRLIYVYEVDGKKYSIKTDYGSSPTPKKNNNRKIRYNPNNPSEAVFIGTNSNRFLIYYGAFATLGSMTFVLLFLYAKGVFDKVKLKLYINL